MDYLYRQSIQTTGDYRIDCFTKDSYMCGFIIEMVVMLDDITLDKIKLPLTHMQELCECVADLIHNGYPVEIPIPISSTLYEYKIFAYYNNEEDIAMTIEKYRIGEAVPIRTIELEFIPESILDDIEQFFGMVGYDG